MRIEGRVGTTTRCAARRLMVLPVLLLTLPRVVKGLAAARTLLERLEETFAAHTAAMALCRIAQAHCVSLSVLQMLSQGAEEPRSGGLQDFPLFSGADAHFAKRGRHAVILEAFLDRLCHFGIQGGPGPRCRGWNRRVDRRGVSEGIQKVGDGGFGFLARRLQGKDLSRSGLMKVFTLWVDGQNKVAGWMQVDMADAKNPMIGQAAGCLLRPGEVVERANLGLHDCLGGDTEADADLGGVVVLTERTKHLLPSSSGVKIVTG